MITGNYSQVLNHLLSSHDSVLSKGNYDPKRKWQQQTTENKKVSMKRRLRKPRIRCIERKVRMLKKLVPNCESMGSVEGLFRETTEYILALQTRVKLMQMAADILSRSAAESHHQ